MNKETKIATILLWVLVVVSAILVISLMSNITENEADTTMGGSIDSNLIWAYILMAAGVGIALLSGIFQMATDLKAAKKGLFSLLFLGAAVRVAYLLAAHDIPQLVGLQIYIYDGTLTSQVAKNIDAD